MAQIDGASRARSARSPAANEYVLDTVKKRIHQDDAVPAGTMTGTRQSQGEEKHMAEKPRLRDSKETLLSYTVLRSGMGR